MLPHRGAFRDAAKTDDLTARPHADGVESPRGLRQIRSSVVHAFKRDSWRPRVTEGPAPSPSMTLRGVGPRWVPME